MKFIHVVSSLLVFYSWMLPAWGNLISNYADYLDRQSRELNGINLLNELAFDAELLSALELPFAGFVEKILKTSFNELSPTEQRMMKELNKVKNLFLKFDAKTSSALQDLALQAATYDYQSAVIDKVVLLRASYISNVLNSKPIQLHRFSAACIEYDPYGLLEVMRTRIESSCQIPTLLNVVFYRKCRNFFIDLENQITFDAELAKLKKDFLIKVMHSNPSHAETLYYKALGQPTTIPNLKNNLREALSDDIPVSPLCFLKVVYTSHDAKRFALDMSLKKLALDLLQIRELAVACKTTNANKEFMGLVNEKIKQIAAHVLQVRKFYLDKTWPDEFNAIIEKRVPYSVAKGNYLQITRDLHDIFVNVDDEDFGYHIFNTDFLENDDSAKYFTCKPDDCFEFFRENLFMVIYRYNKTMVEDRLEASKTWKQKNLKDAQQLLRTFNYEDKKAEDIRNALEEKFGLLSPTFSNIIVLQKAVVNSDYAHIQVDFTEPSDEHYVFLFAYQPHTWPAQDHYVTVNLFV